jgi:hypothetical protein
MAELEFHAELQCELGGHPVSIRSLGNANAVSVQQWSTLLKLARLVLPMSKTGRLLLEKFLDETGSTVEFQVRRRTVASFSYSSGIFQAFGMPPMRLHPIAIATSAFQRKRP